MNVLIGSSVLKEGICIRHRHASLSMYGRNMRTPLSAFNVSFSKHLERRT
jgi:hypothetical protein